MSHDCSKVLAKVILALDGEMSPTEEKNFLDEINHCPSCLQKYDIEKSFKSFLCHKVHKKHISSNTISNIKDKIKDFRTEGNAGL
ncbi:MAG: hypothetical protein HKN92_01950 [Chitinophagales bacterium]|nr:hypothetical protein [Chitinophagales bacterium]